MNAILNRSILSALATVAILISGQLFAQQDQTREQFVYVLHVAPQFQAESSWTEAENAIVSQHFERLAQAAKAGQIILAGRTNESLDKTFGLVIFEAESAVAAREFMQSDPAVSAGLMTATLHPYAVALQRK